MPAVNCVALRYVVASAEPFHCTTAPGAKFAPLTANTRVAAPAVAALGLIEASDGISAVMLNGCGSE